MSKTMSKTEKQIRLCMRIMHRLVRRWYEEQEITRDNCPYGGIKQYGSFTVGYSEHPVCSLTLHPACSGADSFIDWNENDNVQ